MTPDKPLGIVALQGDDCRKVNELCEQFEAAHEAGHRPRIENFLREVGPAPRPHLLYELLRIEIGLRSEAGERPKLQEYLARFPADAEVVARAFAAQPVPEPPPTRLTTEATPDRIGPYKLLQKIGEGGMGEVWMAEQEHPIKRRVALKVIKPGMDSRQIIARFEAERQALALMDHPNIAKVLDAGTTDERRDVSPPVDRRADAAPLTGRPYFVMELVKGVPLTEFCDKQQKNVPERLTIFRQICHAVQHAHQKGIIHRDLKPTNILVESHDGRPVPKIIDFGLAKALLGMPLTEHTVVSQFGTAMGTWQYMSPEQAEVSAIDVDTRADIYSLGVILYELLTGTTPLERERLKKAAVIELQRIIKEEEPPKPSTRLSELSSPLAPRVGSDSRSESPTLASIAAQRHTEPSSLSKFVRGDLDWIVMKALDKQRDRRYDTANAFAADVERFLHHEPVSAGPPTIRYKLRKFVRRNKGPVLAAAGFAALMVLGIIGLIVGIIAIDAERQRTADALARVTEEEERTQAALKDAKEELATREAVQTFFLEKVFAAARPKDQEGGLGKDVTLRKAIDAAESSIAESFKDRPLVEGAIRSVLGLTYHYLGEPGLSVVQDEQARRLWDAKLGPNHPDTLISMNSLAVAYQAAGRVPDAVKLCEEVLPALKAKLGLSHTETIRCMNNLADGYRAAGRFKDAVKLYETILPSAKSKFGPNHPLTMAIMNNQASAYLLTDRVAEAVELYEGILAIQKISLRPEHPERLTCMNNLASAYHAASRAPDAIRLLEEALPLLRAALGPDNLSTLTSMNNLASAYLDAGRLADAIKLFEEVLPARRAKLGRDHPEAFQSVSNLASAYNAANQVAAAIKLLEEALPIQKVKLGSDHPSTLTAMGHLATAYQAAGRLPEAIKLYEEVLPARKAKLGSDHSHTLMSMDSLAMAYLAAGHPDKGLPLVNDYVFGKRKQHGGDNPRFAAILASVASDLLKHQQPAAAEPILRECLAIRAKQEPDAWTTFNTKSLLGGALVGLARSASKDGDKESLARASGYLLRDAEPLLLAGYEGMKQREKTIPPQGSTRIPEAIERLVQLYEAMGKKDEAAKWRKELEGVKAAEKPKP